MTRALRTVAWLVFVSVILEVTVIAAPATAGNVWTTSGPEGGLDPTSLALDPTDPDTAYVSGNRALESGSIFKTTDGGGAWTGSDSGLPNGRILDVAPGADGQTLYAGTEFGVYKSTDAAANWTPVGSDLSAAWSPAVSVSPGSSSVVYAVLGWGESQLYKTTDGGAHWKAILDVYGLTTIAIAPSAPNIIYVVSPSNGIYYSDDAGDTWTRRGINGTQQYGKGIAVHPTDPATVYAQTRCSNCGDILYREIPCSSSCGNIFKSTDGGVTWSTITPTEDISLPVGFGIQNGPILINPITPEVLFAVLQSSTYKSTNGGDSWSVLEAPPFRDLAMHPASGDTVYGIHSQGIMKTTDGGLRWEPLALVATTVSDLAIDRLQPSTVFAAVPSDTVFKTTDGAESWGRAGINARALAVDPTNSNIVFAGGFDGIYRSDLGGIEGSWVPGTLTTIEPSVEFSGCLHIQLVCVPWNPSPNPYPRGLTGYNGLAVDPKTPSTVYAAGYGVFKSIDGGRTWSLTSARYSSAIAIDPLTPTTLYAGGGFSVEKSVDGGATWVVVQTGASGWVVDLEVDPKTPSTLFAAVGSGGVLKSTDGGSSWLKMSQGLPAFSVVDIAIDASTTATLYAAVDGAGVFKSTNGGGSWSALQPNVPYRRVSSVVVTPDGSTLHVGTKGYGVLSLTQQPALPDITPPDTTITSGPSSPSNSSSATFNFASSEAGSSFSCRVDARTASPCSSPVTYTALTDGAHTFSVTATDGAGNSDPTPASWSWTIDTAPPGAIAGKVTNQTTKKGISGATVGCGTAGNATTASDGSYSIQNVSPGNYSCTASASGFKPSSKSVAVNSGSAAVADFALRKS